MKCEKFFQTDNQIAYWLIVFHQQENICFTDSYGSYQLWVFNGLMDILSTVEVCKIFQDPRSILPNGILLSKEADFVFAVGSAKEMSRAKEYCFENHKKLITVPISLTNDAFMTNRIDGCNGRESTEGNYPVETIIIPSQFLLVPLDIQVLGIGEIASLYSSVCDFFNTRYGIERCLLTNFSDLVNRLFEINFVNEQAERILCLMLDGLLYKGLTMRMYQDHTIGAGIDHILARPLENDFGWTHGKSSLVSLLVALLLVPRWQNEVFHPKKILTEGMKFKIINDDDLLLISSLDFRKWAMKGISLRPKRESVLLTLTSKEFCEARKALLRL